MGNGGYIWGLGKEEWERISASLDVATAREAARIAAERRAEAEKRLLRKAAKGAARSSAAEPVGLPAVVIENWP